MRILLVIDSFFTGGAEFSTLELFRFLRDKGCEITICKLKNMNPEYSPEQFGLENEKIITLPNSGFSERRKSLSNLIKEYKPDIVHSVLFNANLLVRSLRVFDSSFVHVESLVNHTYSENRLKEPGVSYFKLECYRWFDAITSRFGTDHFHANGFSVGKHYQEKLFIPKKKITVIHRGRTAEHYNVAPFPKSDFGIDEDKIVLINVGRQEYQKGQDVLLDSISLLPSLVRDKIALLIVGREGKQTNLLQEKVKEKQLEKTVRFLGHRTDIPKLLKMSDIFVFPSRFEGLPGVLIEAEATGLPIICTHLSMMLEVVSVNENALTFETDNTAQLAKAIEDLVTDVSKRIQFSKKSIELFRQNFQIETVHQKMFSMYAKLIQE